MPAIYMRMDDLSHRRLILLGDVSLAGCLEIPQHACGVMVFALDEVAALTRDWFVRHLQRARAA